MVLRRAGPKGEKMVFILDEGKVMDMAFLELMNTLLANGEVPGLFEGDEYASLMSQCKDASTRQGVMCQGNEELYKWFTGEIMKNLHVVFTMNPMEDGMADRAATSPALFNRCVLDWFGDWSEPALFQVAQEFTARMALDRAGYEAPMSFPHAFDGGPDAPGHRDAVANAFVAVHQAVRGASERMHRREVIKAFVTPRHLLEAVEQFQALYNEKRSKLEEKQLFLNVGLKKLEDTFQQVEGMKSVLSAKAEQLARKNDDANAKLQIILANQQEAEEKKKQSKSFAELLATKQEQAGVETSKVREQLAGVEPMVAEAREAVSGIQKKDLKEIQALRNPPQPVKLTCECVLHMLGEDRAAGDWKPVRAAIMADDFIKRVTDFDSTGVTPKIRKAIEPYMNNDDCTVERAYHASKACGPLMKWATAQVSYCTILLSIEPLRALAAKLEAESAEMKVQQDETEALINELEASTAG